VIFDPHPTKFIGVKQQQTVILTGLDKSIGIVCVEQKRLDKGLVPLELFYSEIRQCIKLAVLKV